MINQTLDVNKVFIDQAGKCLKDTFHENTMKGKTYSEKKGYMHYCISNVL